MPLEALILRVDGALIETAEVERQAINRVFAEAGYGWTCDRAHFSTVVDIPDRAARLAQLVSQKLKAATVADRDHLVGAMGRRLNSTVADLVAETAPKPRVAFAEVITEARREGIKIGLVTLLLKDQLMPLLAAAFGAGDVGSGDYVFDVIACRGEDEGLERVYRVAVAELGVPTSRCLAIEACASGLKGASEAGLPAIMVRRAIADYELDQNYQSAIAVLKTLPGIVTPPLRDGLGPFGPEERALLLTALRRVHAGIPEALSGLDRSSSMRVSEMLKTKGSDVKSISAGETIRALSLRLKQDGVGAMVVLSKDGVIEGIISERDIARGLSEHGSDLPGLKVGDLMTKAVIVCAPEDSIATVSKTMTQRRIRHLPVIDCGRLVGLISIGDVLNHRLDQMQQEVNVLRDYAIARR